MNLPKNQRVFWLSLFGLCSILYMVVTLSKFKPISVPIFPPPEVEMTEFCSEKILPSSAGVPTIYLITPTYSRREQIAELTRLGQTLKLAGNIHWVVAEDSDHCSPLVSSILATAMPSWVILICLPSAASSARPCSMRARRCRCFSP